MDRKDFLRSVGHMCVGSGLLACGCGRGLSSTSVPAEGDRAAQKLAWARMWVKRMFDVFDNELDPAERERIMEEMGRACYAESLAGRKVEPMTLVELSARFQRRGDEDAIHIEGNKIHFRLSPDGGGVGAGGGCLCPLVDSGPDELSGTFCHCSVGHVKAMFEDYLGEPVQVELLESIKRGGRACRFKVTLF